MPANRHWLQPLTVVSQYNAEEEIQNNPFDSLDYFDLFEYFITLLKDLSII